MPEIDPLGLLKGKDGANTAASESEWSEWVPWGRQSHTEYRSRKLPDGQTQYECRGAPRYWEDSNSASLPEYQCTDSLQSSGQYENEPSSSLGPYQSPASYGYQQSADFTDQISYQAGYTPNSHTRDYPSSRHSNQDTGETFGKNPYQKTITDGLSQFSPPKDLPRSNSAPVKVTQADPHLDISIFHAWNGERTCAALMDTGAGNGPWIARRIVDELGFEVVQTNTALQAKLLTDDTITSQGVVNLTWRLLKGTRIFSDMQFNIFVSDHFDVLLDMDFLKHNGVVDFNIAPLLPLAEKTKETPEMKDKRKKEAEKQKQGQNASEERRRKAEERRKADKTPDKAKGSSSNNKKK